MSQNLFDRFRPALLRLHTRATIRCDIIDAQNFELGLAYFSLVLTIVFIEMFNLIHLNGKLIVMMLALSCYLLLILFTLGDSERMSLF